MLYENRWVEMPNLSLDGISYIYIPQTHIKKPHSNKYRYGLNYWEIIRIKIIGETPINWEARNVCSQSFLRPVSDFCQNLRTSYWMEPFLWLSANSFLNYWGSEYKEKWFTAKLQFHGLSISFLLNFNHNLGLRVGCKNDINATIFRSSSYKSVTKK